MPWYDIVKDNLGIWAAHPLPAILTFSLGCFAGYLLSKMRHAGLIDALKERILHKDEQIAVKDNAIQSLGTKPPAQSTRQRTADSALPSTHRSQQQQPPEGDFSLRLESQNTDLERTLLRTRYKFVFNPALDRSKIITFLPNGMIGEGRNNNETTWQLSNDKVEIFDGSGKLYSRFGFLNDGRSLHHTNEPDTRSIRGQYMIPIDMPPLHPTHG